MFPLRNFVALSASWFVSLCALQAQTPATGSVTISGGLQGAVYPCGNTSCPTYDSGKSKSLLTGMSQPQVTVAQAGRGHPNNWPLPSPQN
jgi:hypothetical protein